MFAYLKESAPVKNAKTVKLDNENEEGEIWKSLWNMFQRQLHKSDLIEEVNNCVSFK